MNADNSYSKLRLEHYSTGDPGDWDELPEWNPATEPVRADELDGPEGASATSSSTAGSALRLPASVASENDPVLVALGRAAFARYPVQLAPFMSVALASRQAAGRYGLWVDDARGVGGLVRVHLADGSIALALTCSSCHARQSANGIEDGAPNAALDLGKAILDTRAPDPSAAAAIANWGPGRLDVTTTTGTEPARIADLRPVSFQTYLHQDATLRVHDRVSLAIRIETLIITSHGQVLRPPRTVALALASYLASLADSLPDAPPADGPAARGARLFADECSGCHSPPGLTGPPVPLGVVGTDPALGLSADRGTGTYRVPSLHGVGSRGPLLHDASVPSIAALLDPTRPTPGFASRLHGTGAVPGHLYGLELPDADRAALVSYLEAL